MFVTNIYDLFSYTTDVTSNNLEKIKPLYDLKQPKITGAASSLVSDDTTLSANLCMYTNNSGKLTVGDSVLNVGSSKLAHLDGLDKPIVESIENIEKYLDKTEIESQRLIDDVLINVSQNVSNFTTQMIESTSKHLSSSVDTYFVKTMDELTKYVSTADKNKFLINNEYGGNLQIKGSLTTSNLLVEGGTFEIKTDVYKTNQMEIVSSVSSTDPCLNIEAIDSITNILELKSIWNRNAVTMSSTGRMGINISTPVYSLDVDGKINIDTGFHFKKGNNDLSFQDLDLPAEFTPSSHGHTIGEIGGLQTALDNKQNNIDGFNWDTVGTLNISKDLNLGDGYTFKINDVDISSASSASSTRNPVNVTPYNINVNNPNYPYNKGIFLNEGSVTTYSGNVESAHNVESKNVTIKNRINIGNDNDKWRIYTNLDNDLVFENTSDGGISWDTRALMSGSANYDSSVYTNFTGVHHCRAATKDIYDNKYTGYIVSASEQQFAGMNSIYSPTNIGKHFDTNSWDFLPVVALSSKVCDKSVFGVIAKVEGNDKRERNELSGNFVFPIEKKEYDRRLHVAGSGEGGIWVCDFNGILESGDFITTSPIAGIGMKQDNDIVCNYTVGKITMDCDFEPNSIFTSNFDSVSTSNSVGIVETKEYDLKYLDSYGTIIDKNVYSDLQSSNIPVYKMAFVGCSYNCS